MVRPALARRLLAGVLLSALAAGPALAEGQIVTPVDVRDNPMGTDTNPTVTRPAIGAPPQAVTSPDVITTGTIAAGTVGSSFVVPVNDRGTVRLTVTGLAATGATLQAQYTGADGTTWEPIAALRPPLAYGTTITADGQYEVKASGTSAVRLIVTTAGTAGTVAVSALATQAQGLVGLVGSIPPGANAIGTVAQGAAGASPWPTVVYVAGAAASPANPVPVAQQGPVTLGAGTAIVGKVGIDQTTPGTTNGVAVTTSVLPTGAATASGQAAQQGPVAPGAAAANSVLGGQVYNATAPSPANGQQLALQSDAAGNLRINNATLSPGAATSAAQTTVQSAPGTSATTAQGVQGVTGGVPVPVSAASLPLPTGAATASGQTANNVNTFGGGSAPASGTLAGCGVATGALALGNGQGAAIQCDTRASVKTADAGSPDATVGITPAVTQSGTSLLGKASAGNLYAYAATNLSTTAGFVAVVNAAAAPASGAAIAPLECRPLAASGLTDKSYNPGPPPAFSTGIVVLVTTSCSTYTPGGIAFIQALVR